MVHAPDTGRLRSLFARSFKLGLRGEARRSRIAGDPFDRLEPLFDPIPLTETREPETAGFTSSPGPERGVGFERSSRAPRGTTRHAPPHARYGLPGALPSEVFGPYARSAEAELNARLDADEDNEPYAAEPADSLVDRLSRALSAIEPAIEKISDDNRLPAVGNGQESHRRAPAQSSNDATKVMKSNEPLAHDNSHGPLKTDAAPSAGSLDRTRR